MPRPSSESGRSTTICLAALVVVAAAAAWFNSAAFAHRSVVACKGSQLQGAFAVVRGSAGAGNIVYKLTLRNISAASCTLTGLPQAQLLGKTRARLPTHIHAANPGALTAILVRLAPGDTTYANARFSPDVPGPGEQTPGRCEPTAYWLRVRAPGGGTATVKVGPPTPVCEHGSMAFTAYSHKG